MADQTKPTTRREFLAVAAGAAAAGLLAAPATASDEKHLGDGPRWGMVIDLDKCTGCQACAVACREENNVPVAGPTETEKGRAIFWMNMLTRPEGSYPDLRQQILPAPCNHCDDPPCIKVCPVGATTKSDDGVVMQISERCIGCRSCEVTCPFTRRYFNWSPPAWPESLARQLNPDIAVRHHGVIEKCTFCYHRIRTLREQAANEGRKVTDAESRRLTACARTCPVEAITFGNLNDPDSEVSRQAKSPRAFRLLEEMGTHPKVFYLREVKWQE